MTVTSNNALKIKLLMYFVLGLILYVYGQKVMRGKLIDLTNEIVYSKRMEIVKKSLESSYSKFEEIEKGRIQSII
ncbi:MULTISPECIES: hypothetical protein [Bacillus cereus group]|uniref:Cyclic peptide transporter n=2 Tax=Bacillus cereus group TaxID=86661 RepID=A0A1A9PUD0_9BACI|nr:MULTISPECIES: hypothetical protein [Bacillus cereus group]KAA0784706.1 hypothetical protein DN393_22045 [Bacillus sp. BPN334]OUB84025.1 hypothetical protein BK788_15610 [Bacillus thuringiensis serovar sinensis]PFM91209.1 hypothetical protein COJ53_09465 [Bacillus cereus]RFB72388.1 hypothetical protein DZB94_16260 [Bacillus sp. AW]MDR4943082.1 hypothetical protein [Bacillus wiedmannii]